VIAPDNRIVRRTSVERDRQSAWTRGRNQSLKEYVADTAIASLRESPVTGWSSLHQRFAKEGLFLSADNGELKVKDGWNVNALALRFLHLVTPSIPINLFVKWVSLFHLHRIFLRKFRLWVATNQTRLLCRRVLNV
jgi:hypothetical protein